MKNRFIFGMIMFLICAGVLFLTFYVSVSVYDVFILILMIVAAHEMGEALSYKYAKPGFLMQFLTIIISYAVFKTVNIFSQSKSDVYGLHSVAAYFIALIMMVVIIFVINMTSSRKTGENVISSIFCLIYPVAIMFFFLAINYLPGAQHGIAFDDWSYDPYTADGYAPNYRVIAIMMVFICASSCDIAAFAIGSKFKGPKFAPMISPKKTVSGSIGGMLGGMIGAGIVFGLSFTGVGGLTGLHGNVWVSLTLYLSLGLLIGVATEIGDLMASYIKRHCEIKDYGTLIPGHGGIMDRIDGTMISALATYIYMAILVYVSL